MADTNDGDWLQRWLPLIADRVGASPVLELGCGIGTDTKVLAAAGHRVVAVDHQAQLIAKARGQVVPAEFICQDIRDRFPRHCDQIGCVVASLSLHYFAWEETLLLIDRIRNTLRPGGLFLCRLNSTDDYHHGASGHPQIARNFYFVDGRPKRFFDRNDLDMLFAERWRTLSRTEMIIGRYRLPKAVWEIIAEREET
jgi:SAM-dependent methyltransferase